MNSIFTHYDRQFGIAHIYIDMYMITTALAVEYHVF